MSKPKATMADVAHLAGVSRTTAARVVNDNGYVSADNRARVLQAIEASGYRPNKLAQSLRSQRSFTLGLVLSSARANPFFTNMSHAVRVATADAGFALLTVNHGYSAAAEEQGIQQFLDQGVEAVILCHAFRPENYRPLVSAGIQMIQIERQSFDHGALVTLDPAVGMKEAISELRRFGHEHIAYISGATRRAYKETEMNHPEEERIAAFQQALGAVGLSAANSSVTRVEYVGPNNEGSLPGREEVLRIFRSRGQKPTAIIAGSDTLAAGILQALYDLNLRVPDDVSVIGYDDSLANFLTPPLTSIAQPYKQIGETVAELVSELQKESRLIIRSLPTSLTRRASIGSAKQYTR